MIQYVTFSTLTYLLKDSLDAGFGLSTLTESAGPANGDKPDNRMVKRPYGLCPNWIPAGQVLLDNAVHVF